MNAGLALQVALVAEIERVSGLTGVFDGPPLRAAYPYVVVDASTMFDWGHKSAEGREIAVALTLWDDQPSRLHELSDAVEAALNEVDNVSGWSLVNLRFQRKRVVREVAGPWAAALDFRARLLKL